MKVIADVDEQAYGMLCKAEEVDALMASLNELYALIWVQACYDADNEATRTFARKLLPSIQAANKILRFKK